MRRVELTPRFERSFKRLSPHVQTAARKALRNLIEQPHAKSLNLEPVVGRPGFFTIRATLAFRVLLRREEDEDGVCYHAEDVDTHRIYRRK
ncbi:MAG TPA: hypothetical protein VNJ70_00690 [Thermoanaerobaculia bacterium]|nr:hypothetical protein [Thermoanaerobaculia bacterium]